MRKANPVLLEPMMAVEVESPEDFMGNVVGDLSSRRGMIQGMEDVPGFKVIRAEVPLAEMFVYSKSRFTDTFYSLNYRIARVIFKCYF